MLNPINCNRLVLLTMKRIRVVTVSIPETIKLAFGFNNFLKKTMVSNNATRAYVRGSMVKFYTI